MDNPAIYTIDLNFLGRSGTIAAYLVQHASGVFLVETGPGSTIPNLLEGITHCGYTIDDITDIFLTHIHLDHAGAAGWLAKHGCRIHVHEKGAPHLLNPEKLLSSAERLYGNQMNVLWGQFLPVGEDKLIIMRDLEEAVIGGISVRALDVPGHASHHLAYLVGDACFSGDIGGIRLNPQKFLSLPMPPPDLHLEMWRRSIEKIQAHSPKRIVPTHFGVYPDAEWHLQAALDGLEDVQAWMENIMPLNLPLEELRKCFVEFEYERAAKYHISKDVVDAQQIANPSSTSADGILRYWNKFINIAQQ